MSADLLLKLITIPAMLYFVNFVTGAKTDQSLSKLAVSVQYEALRDVAGTTYEESFYSPEQSEEGLEADANNESGYATRVSYFDYVGGVDLAKEQLIARLSEGNNNALSILDTSFTEGIDGYIDVLVADGMLIEEDGSFFENALWGETGVSAENFSGLSGFDVAGGMDTGSAACKPYAEIQKIQSRLKAEDSTLSQLDSMDKGSKISKRLVDPDNVNPMSPSPQSQSPELDMADLVNIVTTAQQSPDVATAIAKTEALDDCFIAQAKTVFNSEQTAIIPIKQMPNLAYYDYFYSTPNNKVNIEDGSASFFLFRKSESSPEDIERRRQIYQTARQQVSKWNAF